ncbi:hypothetical protein M0654_20245 [Rhizobium sp. NTR19]|uniref:Uncharacterized protein n=1 Tax=Neorhizobium turbinariae TaxID=2937795 RepID=A0ABT0IWR8_9HYPH|nr:hypothetical protein [Neorhizobium turbinariae]MCK8782313.1 hypothetical protein [Neorhizobium turbinariae]
MRVRPILYPVQRKRVKPGSGGNERTLTAFVRETLSSEEQAVNEIVATLREYVEELQRKGDPVPFQRVDIVDEDGALVQSFSSAECFASNYWLPVLKEPKH